MTHEDLKNQLVTTWQLHNQILLYLLTQIPKRGLVAVPANSKGRNVTSQFMHLNSVRVGWLHYQRTGKRLKRPLYDKTKPPTREQLKRDIVTSGKDIELFLRESLDGNVTIRMFGKQLVRWIGYLIAHESHHRGQILLALKQSGMRMPEKVSIGGLWGKWIFGK